jgi:hypothetical protein
LRSEDVVELLLVEVDGEFVAVVDAADEVLDTFGVAGDELLELVETGGVDVLRFKTDDDAKLVGVLLLQPVSLEEVCVEGFGEVLQCQVRLEGRGRRSFRARSEERRGEKVGTHLFRVEMRILVSRDMLRQSERRESLPNRFIDDLLEGALRMAAELS